MLFFFVICSVIRPSLLLTHSFLCGFFFFFFFFFLAIICPTIVIKRELQTSTIAIKVYERRSTDRRIIWICISFVLICDLL